MNENFKGIRNNYLTVIDDKVIINSRGYLLRFAPVAIEQRTDFNGGFKRNNRKIKSL